MKFNNLFLKKLFTDYFPSSSCESKLLNPMANYHMFNCVFQEITATNRNGGVINYNSFRVNLLIEECSFYSCNNGWTNTHHYGGCVFFQCSEGSCVLTKICAFECSSGNHNSYHHQGQFAYLENSNVNYVIHVSVMKCPSFRVIYYQYSPIYMISGKQILESYNSSFNHLYGHSGFQSYLPNNFSAKFISICSNIAASSSIFTFQGKTGVFDHLIQSTNMVNNSTPTSGNIFNSLATNINAENCVFANNKDILFSGSITVKDSWIQHNFSLSTGNVIILTSSISTEGVAPTFDLRHFSTGLCLIPTPGPTPQQTLNGLECTPLYTLPLPPTECGVNQQEISYQFNLLTFTSILSILFIQLLY